MFFIVLVNNTRTVTYINFSWVIFKNKIIPIYKTSKSRHFISLAASSARSVLSLTLKANSCGVHV